MRTLLFLASFGLVFAFTAEAVLARPQRAQGPGPRKQPQPHVTPKSNDPLDPQIISVSLKPGYRSQHLNITKERIIVGTLIDPKTIRVQVVGGAVPHIDIPLTDKSQVVVRGPNPATFPKNTTVMRYGENSKIPLKEFKTGKQTEVLSTVIRIDERGESQFLARVRTIGDKDQNNYVVPYSDLYIYDPGRIEAMPTPGPLRRIWDDASAERAGGLVDAAKFFTTRVGESFENLSCLLGSCRESENNALGRLSELRAATKNDVMIPYKEPMQVGWDKFYDYIAGFVGNPINNCKTTSRATGTLALSNAHNLIEEFRDDLLNTKIVPDTNTVIAPEAIASVDICARTCHGEMSVDYCYTKGEEFFPYNLKAVVATQSNRADMITEKESGWFPTAGYLPTEDSRQFAGSKHLDLLFNDPLMEVSLLARQYNNWKCVETEGPSGKKVLNCGAVKKTLCPTPDANPEYSDYLKNPEKYLLEKGDQGIPPPRFLADTPLHDKAFRTCAKYCAQRVFQPNKFKEDLNRCNFDRMTFTSGTTAWIDGCYPLDAGYSGTYVFNGKTYKVNKPPRKVRLPKDDSGCIEMQNDIQCTRFWGNKVVSKDKDGKEVKVSGCLE